ncbi:GNAT family N-acetyltransferase [Glaciecola sp. XM2]|jgi:ribosomal protein S18 acetylase RimI-like enzyme|nr:GNAT family N-acetyltransferase [Glaciecola sp. XM2]
MLGFGQVQLCPLRAHLGRLVISPDYRGLGLSYEVVNRLIEVAVRQQDIHIISLFVYESNKAALTSYNNLGFVPTAYPKDVSSIKHCQYMTLRY